MNRNKKSPYLAVWAFFILLFPIISFPYSIKGVWITRWDLYSQKRINEIIDSLQVANITDAFVQVYGSGYAYFNSSVAPVKYSDFDPLALFIERAHERNINVHAWVNLLYMWDRREMTDDRLHIVNRYPESVLVDGTGTSLLNYSIERLKTRNIEGIFVSPSSEFVEDFTLIMIDEIVKNYAVDGIHLDYSRFPGREFIHDRFIRTDFELYYGVEPESIATDGVYRMFGTGTKGLQNAWERFPGDELNTLVKSIYSSIKEYNPNIQLSSAVFADVDAAEKNFYQFWWEWLNGDYLDFAVIMSYSPSSAVIAKQIAKIQEKTAVENVVIGLAAYNQSLVNVKNSYFDLLVYPVKGFCIFSNQALYDKKGSYSYVGNAIFR